jgi:hypothetical protein
MASLTQVSITTRKAVRYGLYFIIFLIVGRIVLGLAISVIQNLFPTPPPAPTVQFGKLPKIPFPNNTDIPALTYTIQTPEGGLPTLPIQAKVYFEPQSRPDLLALDNTKVKASNLGFPSSPIQVTPTIYRFTSANTPAALEINIVTGTFSIGYNLNEDPTPLNGRPPTPDVAGENAKSFLSRAALLPDDLSGPVTGEFLKVENKQLVNAISLSEANLTKINLFRKDYDKFPSVTSNPNQSNVWFLISGISDQGKQIVGAQYYYYPIDETQFATYPIKKSDDALKDLESGKGYVANVGQNLNGKITIRRVYLAYYDADVQTQFYQPVVVFEGDNGFVAYVPAITSSYYNQ